MAENYYITLEKLLRIFNTFHYLMLVQILMLAEMTRHKDQEILPKVARDDLMERINYFVPEVDSLGMRASSVSLQLLRLGIQDPKYTFGDLRKQAEEIVGRLIAEISTISCLSLGLDKQKLFTGQGLFGEDVASVFGTASFDIVEAGKCLAFDRWIAAVFHLSRVAEIVTVTICKRVGYASKKQSFSGALKYIDSNLEEVRKHSKDANPEFEKDFEFYSKVSAQMHAVNDAWRNRVAHMEKKYTEEEAMRIWDTIRVLMQQLAIEWKEKL